MTNPTVADVRTMVGIPNTEILSDARINLAIADAAAQTGSSDEMLLRYFTGYLLATWWGAIKDTIQMEDIKFDVPKPDYFLTLYNLRLSKVKTTGSGNPVPIEKVSVDPRFSYDTTTNKIRQRKSSDPYY